MSDVDETAVIDKEGRYIVWGLTPEQREELKTLEPLSPEEYPVRLPRWLGRVTTKGAKKDAR